jgi:hypothetical protein
MRKQREINLHNTEQNPTHFLVFCVLSGIDREREREKEKKDKSQSAV